MTSINGTIGFFLDEVESLIPIDQMPKSVRRSIEIVFTDLDDTLTHDGRLQQRAFDALWRAHEAGLSIVIVTGRPAGWCDHLARMWPVAAVVGENGGMAYAMKDGRIQRIYSERPSDASEKLAAIAKAVTTEVPGCKVAADQAYREYDLAIDFCEEVAPLPDTEIDKIVGVFKRYGATVKVSSIHVNGWFGEFDKLSMCKRCCDELIGSSLNLDRATYFGDSPNDVPMFRAFPHAVGVANVRAMADRMDALPAYITTAESGEGFAEGINLILDHS